MTQHPHQHSATCRVIIGPASAILQQAHAADFLKTLPTASVDLFITSPPYFIGKSYDSSNQLLDFEKVLIQLLPDVTRVLKPNSSLCWQVGNHVYKNSFVPLDYTVIKIMESSDTFHLRNRIIWTYSHGMHARRRFSGRHETILWYTKGQDYFFDLDAVRIPQKYPGKRHYKGPRKEDFSGNPLGKNPGDIWEFGAIWDIPNVKANHVEKTDHPCQFPVALVRRLILSLCPVGGTVLDPFAGSGSAAVAALLERRNFIGCDIAADYVSVAKTRLNALSTGELAIRFDSPVFVPSASASVATAPEHFRKRSGD